MNTKQVIIGSAAVGLTTLFLAWAFRKSNKAKKVHNAKVEKYQRLQAICSGKQVSSEAYVKEEFDTFRSKLSMEDMEMFDRSYHGMVDILQSVSAPIVDQKTIGTLFLAQVVVRNKMDEGDPASRLMLEGNGSLLPGMIKKAMAGQPDEIVERAVDLSTQAMSVILYSLDARESLQALAN